MGVMALANGLWHAGSGPSTDWRGRPDRRSSRSVRAAPTTCSPRRRCCVTSSPCAARMTSSNWSTRAAAANGTSTAPCRRVVVGRPPHVTFLMGVNDITRHGDPAAKTAVGAEETRSNLAALRRLATVLSPSTVWTWCLMHPLDPARAARSPGFKNT